MIKGNVERSTLLHWKSEKSEREEDKRSVACKQIHWMKINIIELNSLFLLNSIHWKRMEATNVCLKKAYNQTKSEIAFRSSVH